MALELAKRGIYYYPTAPNSKSGLKGSRGFNDAVNTDSKAREWFQGTANNLGVNLKKSGLMVVDVDVHGGGNGKHNLSKLFQTYSRFPDTLIEKTPRNGLHFFFKVPSGIKTKSKVNAFSNQSGIDLMCDNILIAPSKINGSSYQNVSGSYDDITQVPNWLIEFIKPKPMNYSGSNYSRGKKYTGRLLDKIVKGTNKGQRNDFLTSLAGSMLAVGTDPSNTYALLNVINQNFVSPPILQSELDEIYYSIVTRELQRLRG